MNIINQVADAVETHLDNATLIALVPSPRETMEREGYWEKAFIVVWSRAVGEDDPRPHTDGFIYATHRVHVNSDGETACFMGHYDQSYESAMWDMVERAGLKR